MVRLPCTFALPVCFVAIGVSSFIPVKDHDSPFIPVKDHDSPFISVEAERRAAAPRGLIKSTVTTVKSAFTDCCTAKGHTSTQPNSPTPHASPSHMQVAYSPSSSTTVYTPHWPTTSPSLSPSPDRVPTVYRPIRRPPTPSPSGPSSTLGGSSRHLSSSSFDSSTTPRHPLALSPQPSTPHKPPPSTSLQSALPLRMKSPARPLRVSSSGDRGKGIAAPSSSTSSSGSSSFHGSPSNAGPSGLKDRLKRHIPLQD